MSRYCALFPLLRESHNLRPDQFSTLEDGMNVVSLFPVSFIYAYVDRFMLIHFHKPVLCPVCYKHESQLQLRRGPSGVFTRTLPTRGSPGTSLHRSSGFHSFHSPVPVLPFSPLASHLTIHAIYFWIVLMSSGTHADSSTSFGTTTY